MTPVEAALKADEEIVALPNVIATMRTQAGPSQYIFFDLVDDDGHGYALALSVSDNPAPAIEVSGQIFAAIDPRMGLDAVLTMLLALGSAEFIGADQPTSDALAAILSGSGTDVRVGGPLVKDVSL